MPLKDRSGFLQSSVSDWERLAFGFKLIVFMRFHWVLTFYSFLYRLLEVCWASHCSTPWFPPGHEFILMGGGGRVKSHSSILPFATSLPPSFYFHSATVNVAPVWESRDLFAATDPPECQDLYVLRGKQDLPSSA